MILEEYNEERHISNEKQLSYEEGKEAGQQIGEDIFAALSAKLVADSRTEDLLHAAKDKEFRESLYMEYGIKRD